MTEAAFICEGCWSVFATICPACPDRGHGRGVTVRQIKDALERSPSIADVNDTAKHFGRHVALLEREGGDFRAMAIQIKNLAAYRRQMIGEPWRDE